MKKQFFLLHKLNSFFLSACIVFIGHSAYSYSPGLADYALDVAQPLDLKTKLVEAKTVSHKIERSKGGVLALTLSNGALAELAIPVDALEQDTEITMTELDVESGQLQATTDFYGVHLEPAGLQFKLPAQLKWTFPQSIKDQELVAIGARGMGESVYLTPTVEKSYSGQSVSQVTHKISHFSAYAAFGSVSERERIFRSRTTEIHDRILSWLANEVLKYPNGIIPEDVMKKASQEMYERVIRPRLNSIESCDNGMRVLADRVRWTMFNFAGFKYVPSADELQMLEQARTRTTQLCLEQARKVCYEEHRPFNVIEIMSRVRAHYFLEDAPETPVMRELIDLTVKCFSFEWKIASTITVVDGGEPVQRNKAEGEGYFRLVDEWLNFDSNGSIQVKTDENFNEGCSLKKLENPVAPLKMKAIKLLDLKFDQSLEVQFSEFSPQHNATYECKFGEDSMTFEYPGSLISVWGGFFHTLHTQPTQNEWSDKLNAFQFFKWNVTYQEKFAEKFYKRTSNELEEDTHFIIFHRPR